MLRGKAKDETTDTPAPAAPAAEPSAVAPDEQDTARQPQTGLPASVVGGHQTEDEWRASQQASEQETAPEA